MTRIELTETGPDIDWPLTPAQGRRLARSGVVRSAPSPYDPGSWLVGPARMVGAARIGDVEVRIAPKVAIGRLLFLAGYAQHGSAWRPEDVPLPEAPGLVPVMAQILWRQTERAIYQGLLPGYVTLEDTAYVLRGRLRETEQLHRHHGLPVPLEIRHDEFTVDIPENQILRTACERILRVPGVDEQSSLILRRLLREFADVTSIDRRDPLPAWQPTRLNARYHTALRVAELVLRATSAEQGTGEMTVNGFLLDMPQLFEDFVTIALREALEPAYGGEVIGQDRHHFDEAGRVLLRPDIVWKIRGTVAAVADAKYKAEKPAGYPNADLYQLLAYCTVLGLTTGHLIYAKGSEEPGRHIVCGSGVEILCHAIDLDTEPETLLSQMRLLGARVASVSDPDHLRSGPTRLATA
ncbi:MAG: restriction endonuclease [Actinobacteria bacterium]|nr:restriction endonuclease [Actinomycetota bacterium]